MYTLLGGIWYKSIMYEKKVSFFWVPAVRVEKSSHPHRTTRTRTVPPAPISTEKNQTIFLLYQYFYITGNSTSPVQPSCEP